DGDELHGHATQAGNGHRLHHVGAAACCHEHGNQANHGSSGGHEAGPNALESCLDHHAADVGDAGRLAHVETLLQVAQDHHAVVVSDAEQGDEPDPNGNAQVDSPEVE